MAGKMDDDGVDQRMQLQATAYQLLCCGEGSQETYDVTTTQRTKAVAEIIADTHTYVHKCSNMGDNMCMAYTIAEANEWFEFANKQSQMRVSQGIRSV